MTVLPSSLQKHVLPFFILAASFFVPLRAQESARLPIDTLDKLSSKASKVVEVTLDKQLLQLAAKFLSNEPDEQEAKSLVAGLQGIYVRSFEFSKPDEYTQADLQPILSKLSAVGWTRIVTVRNRNKDESSNVYVMYQNAQSAVVQGVAILTYAPEEVTVVNLVGPVDLDKLGNLEGVMGIPKMGLPKEGAPKKEN